MNRKKSIDSQAASISAGKELGGAEKDCGALVPRRLRPGPVCLPGGDDRPVDMLGRTAFDIGEDVAVTMRHHRLERRAGLDSLAADHHRDVEALAGHCGEACLELGALR